MAGKYSRVTAEIASLEMRGLDAIVSSRLMFDLNPGVTAASATAMIHDRGKKMGILIKSDQRLDQFRTWGGSDWVAYEPDPAAARECALGLGERPGEAWVGLRLAPGTTLTPEYEEGNRMGYRLGFILRNFRNNFQVVPILHACADEDVAQFHTPSIYVLRPAHPHMAIAIGRV
jgi:hypothetical protein